MNHSKRVFAVSLFVSLSTAVAVRAQEAAHEMDSAESSGSSASARPTMEATEKANAPNKSMADTGKPKPKPSVQEGTFSQTDLAALETISDHYVRTGMTGDDWAKLMCPEIMAIQVIPKGVRVLEVRDYRGKINYASIGLLDKELGSFDAWSFESKYTNGGGEKFTSWNRISDGLSRSLPDPLFRNAVVRVNNKLTTTPNIRLVQTHRITPYTLAFIRGGKDRVITSELISRADGGILMRRRVDGKEARSCTYTHARKDQLPGNGE